MSSHGPHHRAFSVSHQRAILDLQLDGRFRALTEITINPLSADLTTVHLHSSACTILSTYHPNSPANEPLEFILNEPDPVKIPDPSSVRQFPEAKRRLFERVNEKENGELAIKIDRSKIKRAARQSEPAESTASALPGHAPQKEKEEFEPIVIGIEYQVTSANLLVNHAICVVEGEFPHVFTNSISARSWIPCVDSIGDRCPWELEFIVPKLNPTGAQEPVMVIASGELLEQIIHPTDPSKIVFHYCQAIPTSVQHIAWVLGPLNVHDLTPHRLSLPTAPQNNDQHDDDDPDQAQKPQNDSEEDSSNQINLHAFGLPNRTSQLLHTVQFLPHVLSFFTQEYGSYPYSSYKVVFVDMSSATHSLGSTFNSATLTLYPSDLLYPPEVIDQVYESKPAFVHALASQWIGINIIPKSPSDTWLINGLSLYITGLYFKSIWGTNEYRYRIKKDMLRCVEMDVNKPPICQPGLPLPIDTEVFGFINLKASLVLYILDRHLRRSGGGTSLGLSRVIPKIFLTAISGDMRDNMMSTNSFLRICRKSNGIELKSWADQWIYASGCPVFEVSTHFNRKKMTHELTLKQLNRSKRYYDDQHTTWEEKCNLKPLDRFEGQMTVRIHESDGVPYEHVLDIKEAFKRYELPSNHKNKRVKRPSRRYASTSQPNETEEAAARRCALSTQTGEAEEVAADRFTYKPWECSQEERDRWKVVDWTEDDDALISQSSVEWIRLDVEVEWICEFKFEMKEFMWLEQLQRDRDVVAQLEAVEALKRLPSKIVSSHLCRTVLTPEYFFRIRVEAVRALVSCATSQCGFLGLFHLLKLFQTYYCYTPKREPDNPFQIRAIPKPNQFNDLAEYFLRKALVAALGQVRDQNHNSPPVCQQFFIDQLIYNDNSLNQYSDAHYIATVISAMTDSFMHFADIAECGEVSELFGSRGTARPSDSGSPAAKRLLIMVNELDRCLMVDRLVPSYRNLLAIAVIEAKLKLMLADLLPVDLMFFLTFTRQGNYPPIRVLAFDCLLLLRGFHEKPIVRYMFVVMRDDQSLLVRRRLAMGFVQCLPILVMMEELGTEPSTNSLSVIDATGESLASKSKLDHKSVTKYLRSQVGRAIILRECVLSVMLHPTVDVDVQTCLLKISEVLFKPSDESVPVRLPDAKPPPPPPELATPTLPKIRIPATPATVEPSPVQAPLPKIILKDSQHHPPANDVDINTHSTPVPSVAQEVPLKLVASLIKKPKPAPKPKRFQASGMSIPDHKMCQNLLKKLASHPVGVPFRKAVDPIRQGAPDYFNIISRPMDFKTMSDKLEMGQYPNREAFRDDFNLVLDNCRTYNLADSPLVIKHAEPMKVIFDKLWERSEKTMNAIQAKGIGGSNAGWQKSAETKPLAAPTSTVPLAPPPSFAAFAAGGSMIPPPPPPTSPGLPASMPSPRLSPEISRPGGLKVKLKPRSSLPSAMATPETPGPSSTMMPPPALKSALKIKLTASSASGSGYTPSMPTSKTSSEVSRALGHTRLTFPPPPTFPVPPAPVVAIAPSKSRPPPHPTFPAPPPPSLESFSFGSKPSSKSPPGLPSASKHLPVVEPWSGMSMPSDRADSQTYPFSDSPPPSQSTSVDPLHVIPGPSHQPPRRPTIIAQLSKPPPHSSTGTPSGSTQTTPLPNYPAPPPPSIPQLGLSPPSHPSVAAGASAPALKPSGVLPPSNPMKIKVIQRSVPQPTNREPPPASPATSTHFNLPVSKPPKSSKSSKSGNKIAKAAVVAAANARASIERSRSNSVESLATALTPPPPSTSPPLKKPKPKHEVTGSSFMQQRSPPPHQSMSRSTSSSSTFLSAPMSGGPLSALTQPDYPPAVSSAAQSESPVVEDILVPKKAKTIIRKMMDLKCALWFRVPVDPVAVAAPTYLDEIKNPMDLSTMIKKLDRGAYKRLSELRYDFSLIVSNCIQFNGALSNIAMDAKEMEKAWNLEWEKAAKMSYTDKRSLLGLFNKLNQVAGAGVFNVPVDPIGLQIPQYFEVIGGEENARDLGTIKANLVADRYNTIQEFEADVRQMLANCFVFNAPDTPVAVIGKDLEKVFDAGMVKIRRDAGLPPLSASGGGGGNKRKGNEGGASSKRTKVG